jgi:4-amino-4-deoxy-L-arabinose transferase-like glycosyltransferase
MLVWLGRHGKNMLKRSADTDGWRLYVLLWSLMTLLFFTISGNIIFPYPLPMLPGCALLFATCGRAAASRSKAAACLGWPWCPACCCCWPLACNGHRDSVTSAPSSR